MSSYAEVRAAIVAVVEALPGLTHSPAAFPTSPRPQHDGYFHVLFEAGEDSLGAPDGGNAGQTVHQVAVEFLTSLSRNNADVGHDLALTRIEGIRNALDAVAALVSVDAYARYTDYALDMTTYPNMVTATAGFAVTHDHVSAD